MSLEHNNNLPYQVYKIKDHKIIHGDAVKILESNIVQKVDLILTDPPMYDSNSYKKSKGNWSNFNEYLEWCYYWLNLCIKKLSLKGSLYLITTTESCAYYDIFLSKHLSVLSRIIWYFDVGLEAKKCYSCQYEPILFCVKNKNNYTFNSKKVCGNVLYFSRMKDQKPDLLLKKIIKTSSDVGGLILDPFAGSFSTSKMAKLLKRKSIGIELNNELIKLGLKKMGINNV